MDPAKTIRTSADGFAAARSLRHHQRITPPPWDYFDATGVVASADRRVVAKLPVLDAVDHANGRVLAAAPELLDAVRALLAVLPDRAGDATEAARRAGLAAIARAEGRAP